MPEKLDPAKIELLLANADIKWFGNNPDPMNYRAHLKFTADYIAKNYNKKAKHGT